MCSCHQRQIAPKEEGTIAALLSRDERRDGSHCWRKGLARQCSFLPTLADVGTHFISLTLLSLICQLVYFFQLSLSLFILFKLECKLNLKLPTFVSLLLMLCSQLDAQNLFVATLISTDKCSIPKFNSKLICSATDFAFSNSQLLNAAVFFRF